MLGEGLCNRCLIQVNSRTSIVARASNGRVYICEVVTAPDALAKWASEMLYGNNAIISIDDMPHAFRVFATWYGDPVCMGHLYKFVDREQTTWTIGRR